MSTRWTGRRIAGHAMRRPDRSRRGGFDGLAAPGTGYGCMRGGRAPTGLDAALVYPSSALPGAWRFVTMTGDWRRRFVPLSAERRPEPPARRRAPP